MNQLCDLGVSAVNHPAGLRWNPAGIAGLYGSLNPQSLFWPGMSSVCGGSGRRSGSSSPKEATRGRRRPQGLVGGYGTTVAALEQSGLAQRRLQLETRAPAHHRGKARARAAKLAYRAAPDIAIARSVAWLRLAALCY
jgi:hypothetical protein